jgi:hypothetical protein
MKHPTDGRLSRRRFLRAATGASVAAAGAGAAQRAAAQDRLPAAPAGKATTLPVDLQWQGAWLTWVAATTTCLRALGVRCDVVDVAGMSGYAFVLNVAPEADVSGPTAFNWSILLEGIHHLGRSTLEFSSGEYGNKGDEGQRSIAHCRAAYSVAAREVAEGRPCVVWGAYLPEFAVVYAVEDGFYLVKSYREVTGEPQPPIHLEDLQAPGGPYVLAFPTATGLPPASGDAYAVRHAAALLRQRSPLQGYSFGLAAYDAWIHALDTQADDFGNAYNAQCWSEGRRFAHEFLVRVAERNEAVSQPLQEAAVAYAEAADAVSLMARTFPFPHARELDDPANRAAGIEALRRAKAAETRACDALEEAASRDWPE